MQNYNTITSDMVDMKQNILRKILKRQKFNKNTKRTYV